jgi:hypothetical protein
MRGAFIYPRGCICVSGGLTYTMLREVPCVSTQDTRLINHYYSHIIYIICPGYHTAVLGYRLQGCYMLCDIYYLLCDIGYAFTLDLDFRRKPVGNLAVTSIAGVLRVRYL